MTKFKEFLPQCDDVRLVGRVVRIVFEEDRPEIDGFEYVFRLVVFCPNSAVWVTFNVLKDVTMMNCVLQFVD